MFNEQGNILNISWKFIFRVFCTDYYVNILICKIFSLLYFCPSGHKDLISSKIEFFFPVCYYFVIECKKFKTYI